MHKRSVIFVGGTSYSGSTMLDMILANDPHGFSCGEVIHLFYPTLPHHISPECGCGDAACEVWREIFRAGPSRLYASIFSMFPDVRFIVDSSKEVCWIHRQEKILRQQGIAVRNALIWKTPGSLRRSFEKRGNADAFESVYIKYHSFYNAYVKHWVGVPYEDFVRHPEILADLCSRLAIDMFAGKQQYWSKRHHTLFGNHSAKIHLYDDHHALYKRGEERLRNSSPGEPDPIRNYRSIYTQDANVRPDSTIDLKNAIQADPFDEIAAYLRAKSIGQENGAQEFVEQYTLPPVGKLTLAARCASVWARKAGARFRYRQHFIA